jgi:alpha-aminoadipic semialdehyde synthase
VPISKLHKDKTHIFFSHTHKAQPYNMSLLDAILEKNIRLIDYERIVDENNNRLIRFGPYAGYSGAIDTLSVTGVRLLEEYSISNPFISLSLAKNYPSLKTALHCVKEVGQVISDRGLPKEVFPFVITIAGTGSVANGIKNVLKELPLKEITVADLPGLWSRRGHESEEDRKWVYILNVAAKDWCERKSDGGFDKQEYYASPELYDSKFAEKILPFSRVIFNAIYWEQKFPRLITTEQIRTTEHSLITIGDISCDPNGSIEFLTRVTSISDPVLINEGVAMLACDHLPAEFPRSSSENFSGTLFPFVEEILAEKYSPPIKSAIIAERGELSPSYEYITKLRAENAKKGIKEFKAQQKKVIIFGAGYCVPPIAEYLSRFKDLVSEVIIVDQQKISKEKFTFDKNPVPIRFRKASLDEASDIIDENAGAVISMVPAFLHPQLAKICIQKKVPMVTASYISPEMKDLNAEAQKRGVLLMNEIGLDPGIDHLCVMKVLREIRERKEDLIEFKSYCGALPAPESATNSIGYKFSWSPMGVMRASGNGAEFYWDGEKIAVPGALLQFIPTEEKQFPALNIEMIPNRDSLSYIQTYNMNHFKNIRTFVRGTLRFPGFTNFFRALSVMGCLDEKKVVHLEKGNNSWKNVMESLGVENLEQQFKQHIEKHGSGVNNEFIQSKLSERKARVKQDVVRAKEALKEFGFLNDDPVLPVGNFSLMQGICNQLENVCSYTNKERDMTLMTHQFVTKTKEGQKKTYISNMFQYGDVRQFSATSKTVGVPAAIACIMIMRGDLNGMKGVKAPMDEAVWDPLLKELEKEGIVCTESTTTD